VTTEKNKNSYVATDEFRPTYDAMMKEAIEQSNDKVKEFGIEETVRIINGLEIAQSKSENFNDFLKYMAKQDYSRVPDDVKEVKIKLLSVLQKMFQLQNANKEVKFWTIAGNAALNTLTDPAFTNNVSNLTITLASEGASVHVGSREAAGAAILKNIAETIAEVAKEKKELKNQLDKIQEEYIEYLSEYYPVYHKYMKEWNKLCLLKDKAYLDLYSGRILDAYNTTVTILEKYPNNRETMLLSALSSIYIAAQYGKTFKEQPRLRLNKIIPENRIPLSGTTEIQTKNWNKYYLEANMMLDWYTELYPDYSAPSLVLKGVLHQQLGMNQQALSYFDQAAMEYPNQAEHLKDLLDAYCYRTYLNKSHEGQYLLKLYRSTMEGYGMFSPNFQKARYYLENNEIEKSQEEIYKHFFRRGNQGIYDCLLSDMEYCEKALYPGFKRMLIEQSFIDVDIEKTGLMLKDDDQIRVKINNRSDIDLENVRIFLCIHYTDMYTDEYDIVKVPNSKNRISQFEENTDMGTVKLDYNNKKFKDIIKVRAIVMTDNKIGWIDNVNQRIRDLKPHYNIGATNVNNILDGLRKVFLKDLNLDVADIKNLLLTQTKSKSQTNSNSKNKAVETAETIGTVLAPVVTLSYKFIASITGSSKNFMIELPRKLALISPLFSINEIQEKETAIKPEKCVLSGQSIKISFNYEPKEGEIVPLYLYSDFITLKINILYKKDGSEIQDIIEII
jgi:hypothetical protein